MEVDATGIGSPKRDNPLLYQGKGGYTQLSEEEKANLIAKKACFQCKKPGHQSCFCYSNLNRAKPPTEQYNRTQIEEPPQTDKDKQVLFEKLGGLEGVYNLVKDGPEDQKEKFVDMVQDF